MPVGADPSAQFQISDIELTLGDETFLVPGQPASIWLSILTTDQLDGAEVLSLVKDDGRLNDLLLAGEVGMDQVVGAIRDLITVASGHPWWWTLGLLSVLRSSEHGTQYLGEMAHIDASSCSLALWTNALYALTVKYMKQEDRTKFDMELDTPPPEIEIEPEEVIDEAASSASFMSMMGNANG